MDDAIIPAGCNELFKNLQSCLLKCNTNTEIFDYAPRDHTIININKCKNIDIYRRLLEKENIILEIHKPTIHPFTKYKIFYDVSQKKISIHNTHNMIEREDNK
jgi:hypothetical protein